VLDDLVCSGPAGAKEGGGAMELDELRGLVQSGAIDTVVLAFPDLQGRLQGKRVHGRFFVDDVVEHGTEGCNYLLATDVEMRPVDRYALASWEQGYGDFVLVPDLTSIRRLAWEPASALCLADLTFADGTPVAVAPREVLRRQLGRLAERHWHAMVGTELELMIFREPYEVAWDRGYRDLTPANRYNVDYSILGTGRIEPLLRRIRNEMASSGMVVESAKGECNLGQHEIAFRYDEALRTADNHVVYKTGAKEIAAQEGMSLTFMAKFDQAEGNSCHIHFSLRDDDDRPVFAGSGPQGFSPVFEHFLAGQLRYGAELALMLAPNINSYKRYVEGSFAPTALAWGLDNRTCALRVVGHGASLRMEHRAPGGDVNPYLAIAAIVAAGLAGVDQGLELEPPVSGNAYRSAAPRLPVTLRDAKEAFSASRLARSTFGDEVVDHYVTMAEVELEAFDAAVTDWERFRGFERL